MYLVAKKRIYNFEDKEKEKNKQIREIFPEMFETNNLDFVGIEFEAGYWRKANAIHKWFVENVQDGNDDCGEYVVSRENLEELLCLCREVVSESVLVEGTVQNGYKYNGGKKIPILEVGKTISNHEVASKLLPTGSGFFFGSTNYDQWYYENIKKTIEIIEKCLNLPDDWTFVYHSSW